MINWFLKPLMATLKPYLELIINKLYTENFMELCFILFFSL